MVKIAVVRVLPSLKAWICQTAKLLTDGAAPTLIAVTARAPQERVAALRQAGAEVLVCGEGPRVDAQALLKALGEREISSVFVEGGGRVNASLLAAGFVDKVYAFVAPKLVGGRDALTPVEGTGAERLSDAVTLTGFAAETVGEDVLLTGYVRK